MQPSHLLTDVKLAERSWGGDRSSRTMALRSLLDAGTVLALGSDAPVEAADPREGCGSGGGGSGSSRPSVTGLLRRLRGVGRGSGNVRAGADSAGERRGYGGGRRGRLP